MLASTTAASFDGGMKLALRLALLLPLALALALPPTAAGIQQTPATESTIRLESRTVILVRHAEKSTEGDPKDPELSPDGHERAQALARLLGHTAVTRLVASEFKRTQATLAPLAEQRKLTVDVRPAGDLDALASELVSGAPGSVTVVCGHSNTLPALAARLGVDLVDLEKGPQGPVLADDQYDRVFVLNLPPGSAPVRPSAFELRYGR